MALEILNCLAYRRSAKRVVILTSICVHALEIKLYFIIKFKIIKFKLYNYRKLCKWKMGVCFQILMWNFIRGGSE